MPTDNPWSCLPAVPALELLANAGIFGGWFDAESDGWRTTVQYRPLDGATRSDYMALCGELMEWLMSKRHNVSVHRIFHKNTYLLELDRDEDTWQGGATWLEALTAAVVAVCKETRDA